MPEGSPVTEKFSISVSPSDESKGNFQPGKIINEQIQPDSYGNFKLSRLAQGFFDIRCELENYKFAKSSSYNIKTVSKVNFSKDKYNYQSSPSDIDGKYLIKNVVAPMKYGIFINGYSNPKHYS